MRRHSPIRDAAVLADANDRATFAERVGQMGVGVRVITSAVHTDIASAQLLEILQYAGNGKPLNACDLYEHFTLALGHIAAARGDGARWFWTDSEPSNAIADADEPAPVASRELFNAAREANDTIGDQIRSNVRSGERL